MSKQKETKKVDVEQTNETTILDKHEAKPKEPNVTKKLKTEIEELNEKLSELALQIISKDQVIENARKEIDALKKDIETMNNTYKVQLISKMELANKELQQKIAENNEKLKKETEYLKKYGIKDQVLSLIDIISQFDAAVNYKLSDEKLINYQKGFKIFLTMFNNLLEELNIKVIEPKINDEFDSVVMECLEIVHMDEFEDNQVVRVISKGYKLFDQILKPAIVKVNKK